MTSTQYKTVKVGTRTLLGGDAFDERGVAVPLETASCRITIRAKVSGEVVVDAAAVEQGPASHQIQYEWDTEAETAGEYEIEWFTVDEDGHEEYSKTFAITVEDRIAA